MMRTVTLAILLTLVLTGCAMSPGGMVTGTIAGTAAGACAGPQLGLITRELEVVTVLPGGSADVAGVEVGDILISMTWVKMERAFECLDTIAMDANGSPLSMPRSVSPIIEPEHPVGPVAFTDQEGINALMHHGVLLELKVKRGDQEVVLEIRPGLSHMQPNEESGPVPTATPLPLGAEFDYY